MKNLRIIDPLLLTTMLLLTSAAIAQTAVEQAAADLPAPVAAARCQYTPADAACLGSSESGQATISTNDDTLAQLPRRIPGPPVRPRRPPMGHPRGGYPGMWMPSGNGRHAAIGAIIGFGLGAALGAKANTDPHAGATVRASLLFGTFGALLGALVSQDTPSFSRLQRPRGPWPDEPDENEMASRPGMADSATSNQTSGGQGGSPRIRSSRPSNAEAPSTPAAAEP